MHFALRLCREKELIEACVQLSALLGLWESAVDLALKVNVDLAKQTANMPQNDNELRKKLWLKIGNKYDEIYLTMIFIIIRLYVTFTRIFLQLNTSSVVKMI